MTTVSAMVERSGEAVLAALQEASPAEADLFRAEFRAALTRAAETMTLTEAEQVLSRWWGVAHLRTNPPTADEQATVTRMNRGETVGWKSPGAYRAATGR